MSKARDVADLGNSLGIDDNATSTAITIDASENVGIGTSTPDAELTVAGDAHLQATSGYSNLYFNGVTDISARYASIRKNYDSPFDLTINASSSTSGAPLIFNSSSAVEAMRIDASGNVGIGTSAPTLPLHVYSGSTATLASFESAGATSRIIIKDGTATHGSYLMDVGDALAIATNAVERLRIDSSGKVLIGATTSSYGSELVVSGGNDMVNIIASSTAAKTAIIFSNPNGNVGTIRTSGSSTAYNTSSDYRLKENVSPITGAADIVMSMRPCTYNFKTDSTDWHDGFIAHELQEMHPRAVSGDKDAMRDEEYEITPATETEAAVMGTRSVPDVQGVDYSKLTPILTAALQEALNKIEVLEAQNAAFETRLTALEATP